MPPTVPVGTRARKRYLVMLAIRCGDGRSVMGATEIWTSFLYKTPRSPIHKIELAASAPSARDLSRLPMRRNPTNA
jgi:hypothetical protein